MKRAILLILLATSWPAATDAAPADERGGVALDTVALDTVALDTVALDTVAIEGAVVKLWTQLRDPSGEAWSAARAQSRWRTLQWYQGAVLLTCAAPCPGLALGIPTPTTGLRITVDGQPLAVPPPLPHLAAPLVVTLPPDAFADGSARLDMAMGPEVARYHVYTSDFLVGPAADVATVTHLVARDDAGQGGTGNEVLLTAYLLLAFIHLEVWRRHRGMKAYLVYSLWLAANMLWIGAPLGWEMGVPGFDATRFFGWSQVGAHLSVVAAAWFWTLFAIRSAMPRALRWLAWGHAAIALVVAVGGTEVATMPGLYQARLGSFAIAGVVLLGRVFYDAIRLRDATRIVAGALLVSLLWSLVLVLVLLGLVTLDDAIVRWIWPLANLQFCLAMAVALAERFAETMAAHERALADLAATHAAADRFVPHAFLEATGHADIRTVSRGDATRQELTVLFSDIRSFTEVSESLDPEALFALINDYLATVVPHIHAHGGFVDKYIGDAVMALFPTPAGALRAVVDGFEALARFNAERALPLQVGVGLHTGPLVLGTLGPEDRLSATVLGDSVNLASRVEGLTKRYGARCVLTDVTVEALGPDHGFTLRELDRVQVKGREAPTTLYELVDADPPDLQAAKRAALGAFDQARAAFFDGRFAEAIAAFEAIVRDHPQDAGASRLLSEARAHLATPPGDWQGVTRLTSK